MKQGKFIDVLRRAADECGLPLTVRNDHHGVRLSTAKGSVRLSPDQRQDIQQRHFGRYFKNLGFSHMPAGSR